MDEDMLRRALSGQDLPEGMTLPVLLADWQDYDVASYLLGRSLGLFASQTFQADVKWVFWSRNPLGDMLFDTLGTLANVGVLERAAETADSDLQFRWHEGYDANERKGLL